MATLLTACAESVSAPVPTTAEPAARYLELERRFNARIGVFAIDTGTGRTLEYRADERFALCSIFKALAVAAVLARNPLSHLDSRVTFSHDDIRSISPVTQKRVDTGMTIGELCDAAIRYSDGTAGNLLVTDLGGPAALTAYLREIGDQVGRLDNYEPELNRAAPGDPVDTTTPRAIGGDFRTLLLGSALPDDKRAMLTDWLLHSKTAPGRIRAAVPPGWSVADKTGTGDYGRANDIAVVRPPSGAPLVSDRAGGYDAEPSDELIAEAARHVIATLR
ncbi:MULTISPECIES: class A beta-lactamase [unclassified Nocardia]|uniref:class A beta-lactamase n=1 Tax=unclassified Nocardia TaxID=2637762 RepID=UPI001CE4522A|nr:MULTISPECIES: class A beta-lactamase [unclassified Nocardia]